MGIILRKESHKGWEYSDIELCKRYDEQDFSAKK